MTIRIDSFDEWVIYAFDHPVEPSMPAWHWDWDAASWDELKEPGVTVEYLTRFFEDIAEVAAPYTDAQLNQGLWFIGNNACSSHMFAVNDEHVPLADRVRCIHAMSSLYENLFAVRCTPHLGHRSEEGNPLNSACYMWWDILPIGGDPKTRDGQQLNQAMLDVMQNALEIDSDACRESALHGLGHSHYIYPEKVEKIIDAFLKQHPNLRPELEIYAKSARGGCVL